jgi:hypothetical protein
MGQFGVDAGRFSSLALNSSGLPVATFTNTTTNRVSVLECPDTNCDFWSAHGVGPAATTGSSLALDAQGRAVFSYSDFADGNLGLLSCSVAQGSVVCDPNQLIDTVGIVGSDSSLELDANDRPVISYYDFTNGNLKVAHCNEPNCVGGDESLQSPDTGGNVGPFTSLELDAAGNPVVSYFDSSNSTIKIMHCNDPNCAGGDESIQSPDPATFVGSFTSLALDALGRPVVSYYDGGNGRLKVMHCNDANCAGGDESIQTPDTSGLNGTYSSLAIDAFGRPAISYYDSTNGDLKIMRCNDANCAGGGESIRSPDTADNVGQYTSLVLDAVGNPVVSYYDVTNADLKVLRCGTPTCYNNELFQEIRATSFTTGWEPGLIGGVCYNIDPTSTADPTFVVCDNETGPGIDTSPRCTKDGGDSCTDVDPALGSISVATLTGSYDLTISNAPGHIPDSHVKSCNVAGGVDAKCSFTNTPKIRPWFPWDVTGDGAVSGFDIFEVLGQFGQTK